MKNKLKLGQAAGVVAFAIIIGAVSMSSSSTVDARTSLKENRTVNAGVALGLTEAADATELLTAGVTSALTYYGADVSVAQNDSNVVTASAQGAQVGNTAQETEQANEASQTPTAAQTWWLHKSWYVGYQQRKLKYQTGSFDRQRGNRNTYQSQCL